jgi:hypothetical protein
VLSTASKSAPEAISSSWSPLLSNGTPFCLLVHGGVVARRAIDGVAQRTNVDAMLTHQCGGQLATDRRNEAKRVLVAKRNRRAAASISALTIRASRTFLAAMSSGVSLQLSTMVRSAPRAISSAVAPPPLLAVRRQQGSDQSEKEKNQSTESQSSFVDCFVLFCFFFLKKKRKKNELEFIPIQVDPTIASPAYSNGSTHAPAAEKAPVGVVSVATRNVSSIARDQRNVSVAQRH